MNCIKQEQRTMDDLGIYETISQSFIMNVSGGVKAGQKLCLCTYTVRCDDGFHQCCCRRRLQVTLHFGMLNFEL